MEAWWAGIPALEQALFLIGAPSALILLIQTILLLFSGGGGDQTDSDTSGLCDGDCDADAGLNLDSDVDLDGGPDTELVADPDGSLSPDEDGGADAGADHGLRLFSVRGIIGFLAVGSWAGIAALECGLRPVLALIIALASGLLSLVLIAKLIQLLAGLQENGTVSQRSALGESGTVYIPIPARRHGAGKVQLVLGEQLMELDAVTEGEAMPTGTQVRVTDLSGGQLVVERDD